MLFDFFGAEVGVGEGFPVKGGLINSRRNFFNLSVVIRPGQFLLMIHTFNMLNIREFTFK